MSAYRDLAELRRQQAGHAETVECMRNHRAAWRVVQRHGNASAFNGYHWTPSDYSCLRCTAEGCGRVWRTKAAYVEGVPDAGR
jgi:hypothetical protein